MRLCSRITSRMMLCTSALTSSAFSMRSAMRLSISATMTLMAVLQSAMLIDAPSIRNSNLLPVKANGEVRLRSEISLGRLGMVVTPISILPPWRRLDLPSVSISVRMSVSKSPRKIETMAGGASLPPRR